MRVLLDEQLPRGLARELIGHDVSTVQREGWAGVNNGELLRRAEVHGFDALLTADQSLSFQQNLALLGLAVIILKAPTTKLKICFRSYLVFCSDLIAVARADCCAYLDFLHPATGVDYSVVEKSSCSTG